MAIISNFYIEICLRILVMLLVCIYLIAKSIRLHHLVVPWKLMAWGSIGLVVAGSATKIFQFRVNNLILLMSFYYLVNTDMFRKILSRIFFRREIILGIASGVIFGGLFWLVNLGNLKNSIASVSFFWVLATYVQVAIGEELLFRSYFLDRLLEYDLTFWESNLLQSLLFVSAHTNVLMQNPTNWNALVLLLLFSLAMGWLMWKRQNILIVIVAHFVTIIFAALLIIYQTI